MQLITKYNTTTVIIKNNATLQQLYVVRYRLYYYIFGTNNKKLPNNLNNSKLLIWPLGDLAIWLFGDTEQ